MFVGRRGDNSIYGLWTTKQFDGQEELPDDHPDIQAFLHPALTPDQIRTGAIDDTIATDATIISLKAMDNAAFDAWWAANVTNLAQANVILKRLTRIVVRRL